MYTWKLLEVSRTQIWQSEISESQWYNDGSLKEIADLIGLPSLTSCLLYYESLYPVVGMTSLEESGLISS